MTSFIRQRGFPGFVSGYGFDPDFPLDTFGTVIPSGRTGNVKIQFLDEQPSEAGKAEAVSPTKAEAASPVVSPTTKAARGKAAAGKAKAKGKTTRGGKREVQPPEGKAEAEPQEKEAQLRARERSDRLMVGPVDFVPPCDIADLPDGKLLVAVELPGVKRENINIVFRPWNEGPHDHLVVYGWRNDPTIERWRRAEIPSGRFRRTFKVPKGLSGEKTETKFDRGELHMIFPKIIEAVQVPRGKRIAISGD